MRIRSVYKYCYIFSLKLLLHVVMVLVPCPHGQNYMSSSPKRTFTKEVFLWLNKVEVNKVTAPATMFLRGEFDNLIFVISAKERPNPEHVQLIPKGKIILLRCDTIVHL